MKKKQLASLKDLLSSLTHKLTTNLRPHMVPGVQWHEIISVEWPTADKRVLYVDLGQVSHISSGQIEETDGGDEEGGHFDGAQVDLEKALNKPATLHLKNGDQHRLSMTYGQATSRLRTVRAMIMDKLNTIFGSTNHDNIASDTRSTD